MNQLTINNQSNILQRVKLLMEYNTSLTYDENLHLITEQDKKWISYLGKEITYKEAQDIYTKLKYEPEGFSTGNQIKQIEDAFPDIKFWYKSQPHLNIRQKPEYKSPYPQEYIDRWMQKIQPKENESEKDIILRLRKFLYESNLGPFVDIGVRVFGEGGGNLLMTGIDVVILLHDLEIYLNQPEEFKNKHWFLKLFDSNNQSFINIMTDVVFMGLFLGIPGGYQLAKNIIVKSERRLLGRQLKNALIAFQKLLNMISRIPYYVWEYLGLRSLFTRTFPKLAKFINRELLALEFRLSAIDVYIENYLRNNPNVSRIFTPKLRATIISNAGKRQKWTDFVVMSIIFKLIEGKMKKYVDYLCTPEGEKKLIEFFIKIDPEIKKIVESKSEEPSEEELKKFKLTDKVEEMVEDYHDESLMGILNKEGYYITKNGNFKLPVLTKKNTNFSRYYTQERILIINGECYYDLKDELLYKFEKVKC